MTDAAQELLARLLARQSVLMSDLRPTSRAAIGELEALGLAVVASQNGAVHLPTMPDVIDPTALARGLATPAILHVETLRHDLSTGSTNADALAAPAPTVGRCAVYLAEHQSAGQGRRGKHWRSAFATGLCISVAFRMPASTGLARLPLALGVGLRRALLRLGVTGAKLKWPNDLVVDGRKLGGLLMSARQLAKGDTLVVAGLGMNAHEAPPRDHDRALEPTSLAACLGSSLPNRTTVAIALINAMRQTADEYSRSGFASFATDWVSADYLHQRAIRVLDEAGETTGVAQGIDDQGRLLLQTAAGVVPLNGGEVSVRPVGYL